MWFPKIKKIQKLNLLKSGLNGGQKGILFFVHVNMNVSRIILILVANWQEIFGEWLINPRPKTESSEVTLFFIITAVIIIIIWGHANSECIVWKSGPEMGMTSKQSHYCSTT